MVFPIMQSENGVLDMELIIKNPDSSGSSPDKTTNLNKKFF